MSGPSKYRGRQPLKIWRDIVCLSSLKALFHKFYLVHSWVLYPKYIRAFYNPKSNLVQETILKIHNLVQETKKSISRKQEVQQGLWLISMRVDMNLITGTQDIFSSIDLLQKFLGQKQLSLFQNSAKWNSPKKYFVGTSGGNSSCTFSGENIF